MRSVSWVVWGEYCVRWVVWNELMWDEWDEWCEMVVWGEWWRRGPFWTFWRLWLLRLASNSIETNISELHRSVMLILTAAAIHKSCVWWDIRQYSSDTTHLTENSSHTTHLITLFTHKLLTSSGHIASPIGTATPNAIYTQLRAKPPRQEHINAKFSHLLLAQLPRTQFRHSKLPKPHGRNTSTHNFRISYWHSYPERRLHTASCQSRMAGRHQHKIFASPIGTATPNDVYTQQAPKAASQNDINTKFSHLRMTQLPWRTFTHSKLPKPHGRATSTQNFCIFYWHSYPERRLHTASSKSRITERHQHKIFASPIGTATPNTI